ncbi:MAG TPA: TraB/GumN family protein [Polyangiales bacterium]|nr:TraB/GumN family protein [Polyangiales bacterium]
MTTLRRTIELAACAVCALCLGLGTAYPLAAQPAASAKPAANATPTAKPRAPSAPKAAGIMQKRGLYAPPDALDKHLDPATMAKLKTAIEATGLPVQPFMQMRPWFVAMTVALLRLQADGFEPKYGIDVHFSQAGKAKRFQALETIEEQAGLLADMPVKLQVDNLRQTLDELDQAATMMRSAFAAWRRGDGPAIDELMLAPFRKQYPPLYKRLFVDRNRRMAKEVERLLTGKGTAFVVVGAGHLVGKDSIIRMLTTRARAPLQL